MCGGWGTMKLLRSAYLWRGGEKIPIIWLSSHPVTSSIQHPVSPTVNTTGTVLYVSFTGYVLTIPRFPPLRGQMSTHLQSAASACFTDMAHAVFVFREKMQKSTSTVNILTCRYASKSSRWRLCMDEVGRSIEYCQLSLSHICILISSMIHISHSRQNVHPWARGWCRQNSKTASPRVVN